eukprot:jgi/Astpho2/9191/fgenesh1_pg.00137_%23_17_t
MAPLASQAGLALSGCQPQPWPKHGCWFYVQNLGLTIGDEDGKPVYVGRVRASAGRVAASYGGKEHQYTSGELLVLSGDQMPIWVDAADGAVPAHAVGCPSPDRPGEQEFVGRAEHHGTYMSGKVVPWRE